MLKVLELFSGTRSVGKVADSLGWEVLSLDLEMEADIQIDIMKWDYKRYPRNTFDIVWASPPCTFYSNLQNCWIGRKRRDGVIVSKEWIEEQRKESDILIKRTLEIINYFNPALWFMENPQTGQLKHREVVKGLPYYDVSYCMYSDWGYEKRTRIWTNKKDWKNLICDKSGACGNMEFWYDGNDKRYKHKIKVSHIHSESTLLTARHKTCADGGYDKRGKHYSCVQNAGGGTNRLDRYRIPPDLIYSLFVD